MTITIYSEVILPETVMAAGVRGINKRRNTRKQSATGIMTINIEWYDALRQYEVGFIPMDLSAWQEIEGLFDLTYGGAFGFLMRDPKDHDTDNRGLCWAYNTGALSVIGDIGIGSGATNVYQLAKQYTAIGNGTPQNRIIRWPFWAGYGTPNIVILVNDIDVTANTTVDRTTGLVTFNVAPPTSFDSVAWSGSFFVPVHFANDDIDWEIVRSGPYADRLVAGPSVVLMEVRQ